MCPFLFLTLIQFIPDTNSILCNYIQDDWTFDLTSSDSVSVMSLPYLTHSGPGLHESPNGINFHTEWLLGPLPPLSAHTLHFSWKFLLQFFCTCVKQAWDSEEMAPEPQLPLSLSSKDFLPQARGALADSLLSTGNCFPVHMGYWAWAALDTDTCPEPRALWNQI